MGRKKAYIASQAPCVVPLPVTSVPSDVKPQAHSPLPFLFSSSLRPTKGGKLPLIQWEWGLLETEPLAIFHECVMSLLPGKDEFSVASSLQHRRPRHLDWRLVWLILFYKHGLGAGFQAVSASFSTANVGQVPWSLPQGLSQAWCPSLTLVFKQKSLNSFLHLAGLQTHEKSPAALSLACCSIL
jgi:hypothetical protein